MSIISLLKQTIYNSCEERADRERSKYIRYVGEVQWFNRQTEVMYGVIIFSQDIRQQWIGLLKYVQINLQLSADETVEDEHPIERG